MLIECQDRTTFIMSSRIVCFEIMDSANGSATIFAHTDDSKFSGPFELCKFSNRESAVSALSSIARKASQGSATYNFGDFE